jgi:hypothetical protein
MPPPARRRLQPASDIKAKLLLCSLSYAERKILSGENQNHYLMLFDDRHCLPALQAGAKQELCFYVRRRLEPTPSGVKERRRPPVLPNLQFGSHEYAHL